LHEHVVFLGDTTTTDDFRDLNTTGFDQLQNHFCTKSRGLDHKELISKLNAKLRGYYNYYYGVSGNADKINKFDFFVNRILFKWLNRRSQRNSYAWEEFNALLKAFPMIKPKVVWT
jgi:hypothetical protein